MRQSKARRKATRWALSSARRFISKWKRWKRKRKREGILIKGIFK
jgi:hypothetical protein